MGREPKILLGFLGLLAGAFFGVLSMKMLVPRPPAGAGPDVHADLADEPHDLVEPPRLTMRASDFAAAPPLVPAAVPPAAEIGAADRYADRYDEPVANAGEGEAAPRDPFVAAASFEQEAAPPADTAATVQPIPLDEALPADASPDLPADPGVGPAAILPAIPSTSYVVRQGDSWWSLAERAYGDGRLYRALFAWNRGIDSRVTLAAGTPLQIPPLADLAAAWPQLMPR